MFQFSENAADSGNRMFADLGNNGVSNGWRTFECQYHPALLPYEPWLLGLQRAHLPSSSVLRSGRAATRTASSSPAPGRAARVTQQGSSQIHGCPPETLLEVGKGIRLWRGRTSSGWERGMQSSPHRSSRRSATRQGECDGGEPLSTHQFGSRITRVPRPSVEGGLFVCVCWRCSRRREKLLRVHGPRSWRSRARSYKWA